MLFILKRAGFALALLVSAVFSQLPEFAQQYRQRLGGAVDELTRVLADFDQDAATHKMTRDEGIQRLQNDPDYLVSQRGARLRQTEDRLARLDDQLTHFQSAGPVTRLAVMAKDFDTGIASRAWQAFEPAVPLTFEGVMIAVAGFFAAIGVWRLLLWPLNRRHRRRAELKQRAALQQKAVLQQRG